MSALGQVTPTLAVPNCGANAEPPGLSPLPLSTPDSNTANRTPPGHNRLQRKLSRQLVKTQNEGSEEHSNVNSANDSTVPGADHPDRLKKTNTAQNEYFAMQHELNKQNYAQQLVTTQSQAEKAMVASLCAAVLDGVKETGKLVKKGADAVVI